MVKSLDQLTFGLPDTRLIGDARVRIAGVSHVSSEVQVGDLFVAIRGFRDNGERYIGEAIHRGAAAIMCEGSPQLTVPVVQVSNSRRALAEVSARLYDYPSARLRVVGVTGTNGKTTTTCFLQNILTHAGLRTGVIGTAGYRIGDRVIPAGRTTPESAYLQRYLRQMVDRDADYAIVEVSAHALTLDRVHGCEFDVAVFTNLAPDHLNFYPDMDQYRAAKSLLFSRLGGSKPHPIACVNSDDPAGEQMAARCRAPVISYGINSGEFRLSRVRSLGYGALARLHYPDGEFEVTIHLPGTCNLYNALAAATVALADGIAPGDVAAGIAATTSIPGRYRLVSANGLRVWVDFAHNPTALQNMLEAVRTCGGKRLIAVTGCEGGTDRNKRRLTGRTAARFADYVVVTSDNIYHDDPIAIAGDIELGLRDEGRRPGVDYTVCIDRYRALELALELADSGDAVVVAGKGCEDYLVVGTRQLPFNDEQVIGSLLARKQA